MLGFNAKNGMARPAVTAGFLALALVLVAGDGSGWAEDAGAKTRTVPGSAKPEATKPEAKAKAKSIGENIKQLKNEITDPATPGRIKGHEQEAEKKVESVRDRQRRDHGKARVSDAVDLGKSVDKEPVGQPVPSSEKTKPKP